MGQRGPKPLPANVHMLRGNPSKLPLSQLMDEVRPPVEIPTCPRHLLPAARREWARISKELRMLGLVSQIDRAALAVYCQAYARWAQAEAKIAEMNGADEKGEAGLIGYTPSGYQQMSVWLQISNRAVEQMHKALCEFGMTPSARSRVTPSDPQIPLPGMGTDEPQGWSSI